MRASEFLQSDTGRDRADPFLGMPADDDESEQPVSITSTSGPQSASQFLKGAAKETSGVENNSAPQFLRSPAAEGSGEPSLLRKADIALGKIIHPALYYSGMEGLGRLWDLPANVGYGVWEGGKKALKGDVKEGLKEPVKAAVKTLSGEGYYDLDQAGLPAPEGKITRPAAEIVWGVGKNPLNFLLPYKHHLINKAAPPKPIPTERLPPLKEKGLKPKRADIDTAADQAATSPKNNIPEPTEAQIRAGNYKKGKINLHGMEISIENPRGSTRKGVSPEGKPWESKLEHHYGYIKRTEAPDGDAVDVFIGPKPESEKVFVIDQVDPKTGKFDEPKIMMGFPTEKQARVGYLANYERGWKGLGGVREMDIHEFKNWLKNPDQQTKQVATSRPGPEKIPPINPEDVLRQVKTDLERGHDASGHPVKVADVNELRKNPAIQKMGIDDDLKVLISQQEYNEPGRLIRRRINEKYGDILELEPSETVGKVYGLIDSRRISPETLDKYLQKVENSKKPEVIQNIRSVISNQIGDLIETHRYESHQEGRAIETYLDGLLEVTERHAQALSGPAELRNTYPPSQVERTGRGTVPDNRRGLTPGESSPARRAIDFLKSESGSVEAPRSIEYLKQKIENLEEGQPLKGFKIKARRTMEGVREAVQSPQRVYERDPVGRKIYKTIDWADQKKNSFLAQQGEQFVKAAGKIKEGSESAARVGQALDGKLKPEALSNNEKILYRFMKNKYHFLIQKYARTAAGTEKGYMKVLRAANKEKMPFVKVKDLPEEAQAKYTALKDKLSEIRNGRPLKELNKKESERYWDTRREMTGVLEEEWKKGLTAGEREAYDVLSKRIKDYLPHLFDRDELLNSFKNEITRIRKKMETATDKGAITRYKENLRKLEDAIVKLNKGYLVTYDNLPQYVKFRFFESRKGKAGYSFDAVKAYQTYLQGIARKIYDEPAIRRVAEMHKELDPSLKSYNKWYVRHYMGWDRHKLDDLAGAVASFQWMRTLGANPRSAIVNLTQRLNTVAEVGVKHSLKGEALGFTREGKKLFDSTGIAKEIPTVLMEGSVPEGMEKVRAILGYMFNKVELGNRKHAFLSAYSKNKAQGMAEKEAVQKAVDTVHKTQFRYGRVGMPKALTHPVGRLAGQFWSYPIKQVELIVDWAKNDPGKLIKYIAYAEGGNYALNEFLGIDLSNALGFGVNWGEAIKAIRDIPEKDWRGFFRHLRLTFSSGGGLLPSGLGPTASGVGSIVEAMKEGRGLEQFKKELTPIQYKRLSQAYKSIRNRKGERYPVFDRKGHIMYYLTGKELASRTLGPRPAKESKEYLDWRRASMLEQERREVMEDITGAIAEGNINKATRLIDKYKVIPAYESIINEVLKRTLSSEERKAMKAPGVRERYQMQREGHVY